MTIAIGFIHKDGITFASDSQMSWGDSFKQFGFKKIVGVDFAGDNHAMLAKAGDIEVAGCFEEILQENAKVGAISDARSMAGIVEQSLKEARDKMLSAYHHPTFEPGSGQRYLQEKDAKFLVAYFYGGKPCLYSVGLEATVAIKQDMPFIAIGSGQNLASFILTGYDLKTLALEEAIGMAAYAVEMCKTHDQYCGGRLQLGTLSAHNEPSSIIEWSPIIVDAYIEAVAAADTGMIRELPLRITRHLETFTKKLQALKDAGLIKRPLDPKP